jgi:hypothetical protein
VRLRADFYGSTYQDKGEDFVDFGVGESDTTVGPIGEAVLAP